MELRLVHTANGPILRAHQTTADALTAGDLNRRAEPPGRLEDDAPLARGVLGTSPRFERMKARHGKLKPNAAAHRRAIEIALVMPNRVGRELPTGPTARHLKAFSHKNQLLKRLKRYCKGSIRPFCTDWNS